MTYKLAEAKDQLSKLFTRAMTEGPQRITRRGETVVVVSEREWVARKEGASVGPALNFKEHLLAIPLPEDFEPPVRDRTGKRSVDFDV